MIVFDVNETLSDLSALGARFVEVGASASAAPLWFASVLRDGFALTVAGDSAPFAGVARELLLSQLSEVQLNRSVEEAAGHVMDGFAGLELHADVASGLSRLHEGGFRLVTLSNGAASVAERLLDSGNVLELFERLLSVEAAGAWKPARAAYAHAASECDADPADMLMVAVHPWDVHGARRAGMQSAWVNRWGSPFPAIFDEPTYTVASIEEIAELWTEVPHV
ncbi:MAG TPA: haloacid dehalogenase type II [Nocardioidaceae bacterium]|nr:haloacid dehalogenase type II [Nocardioidaceae bacterium]